jgi:hypothetical protein
MVNFFKWVRKIRSNRKSQNRGWRNSRDKWREQLRDIKKRTKIGKRK